MLSMCLLFCFVVFWMLCCVMCKKKKKKTVDKKNKKKTIVGLQYKEKHADKCNHNHLFIANISKTVPKVVKMTMRWWTTIVLYEV